jgi:aldehyde dehydrogenase (NAD(P)+)
MQYHADNIVSGLAHNASHNCCALEVLVTARDWPQRDAFLAVLRQRLGEEAQRAAWYPGSEQRMAAFRRGFPQVG